MTSFESAQQSFSRYQTTGDITHLRDSLDRLDSIIENINSDSHKAENFKKVISKAILDQIQGLQAKGNIPEFAKNVKTVEDIVKALLASLNSEDANKYVELIKIRSDYFK